MQAPPGPKEVCALDATLQTRHEHQAQIMSVEDTIRMPAWRSDSPKKRNTRKPHTSRTMLASEATELTR